MFQPIAAILCGSIVIIDIIVIIITSFKKQSPPREANRVSASE